MTLKRKYILLSVLLLTITLIKDKQLPFLGHQKSDQKSTKRIFVIIEFNRLIKKMFNLFAVVSDIKQTIAMTS